MLKEKIFTEGVENNLQEGLDEVYNPIKNK